MTYDGWHALVDEVATEPHQSTALVAAMNRNRVGILVEGANANVRAANSRVDRMVDPILQKHEGIQDMRDKNADETAALRRKHGVNAPRKRKSRTGRDKGKW